MIPTNWKLKANEVLKAPAKGMVALLKYDDTPSNSQNILVKSLGKSKIFMRLNNLSAGDQALQAYRAGQDSRFASP